MYPKVVDIAAWKTNTTFGRPFQLTNPLSLKGFHHILWPIWPTRLGEDPNFINAFMSETANLIPFLTTLLSIAICYPFIIMKPSRFFLCLSV
jgi:hypothetical protein